MPIAFEKVKGLKRPNQQQEYTNEQIKEIMRCSKDIYYFAEKYFTIIEEKRGKHIVKLFDYQREMVDRMVNNRYVIFCCGRQLGKTTCATIYLLWLTIFDTEKTVGILANKENSAKSIINDIKTAYLELPDWLKPGVEKWDQLTLKFDNGSSIIGGATATDSFRGETLSCLFLDEFAFVPQEIAEAFFTSVFPTLSTGGRMIIVSTPNGSVGKFYDIFSNAGKSNPFTSLRIDWSRHPDRDEKWKNDMLMILGKVKFAQEHEVKFTGSSNTIVDGDILERIRSNIRPPIHIFENGLKIWKKPDPNRAYAFGVDVSKGAGNNTDYSVINIFDITDFANDGTIEQVGLFRKNDVVLFKFIDILYDISKLYPLPSIIVENNGTGEAICAVMFNEKEYENMYFDYEAQERGINANGKTKPLAVNFFKSDIETGNMIVYAEEMYKELCYFEEIKPGIFRARQGRDFHDDTISSSYWVSYMLRSRYYDDILWYTSKTIKNNNEPNNDLQKKDEEILQNFNKYIRPLTEQDIFRKSLRS